VSVNSLLISKVSLHFSSTVKLFLFGGSLQQNLFAFCTSNDNQPSASNSRSAQLKYKIQQNTKRTNLLTRTHAAELHRQRGVEALDVVVHNSGTSWGLHDSRFGGVGCVLDCVSMLLCC
jgi:hypothetical protein